jgi:uncharacterized protein
MAVGNTFVVEKYCPVCGKSTRITKVRSRLLATETDNDFCAHYKDFNPYYYTIWVCEHCGFATDEKRFLAPMPEKHRIVLSEFLNTRKVGFKFQETRGIPEAVASFKLAIFYAELLHAQPSHLAGLCLELAWIFRDSGEQDRENDMMEKAVNLYDESLMHERYPIGSLTDTMVIYLIGALYYRLGNIEKATQYLSRIIGDHESRIQERKLYEKARDLWQDIRTRGTEGN